MIVQSRHTEFRLITQHHHGILSGELAANWNHGDGNHRLSDIMVVTTSLHDLAWNAVDSQIHHWNQGQPEDFIRFPEDEKLVLYQRGVEHLAEIHPYAGLLLSHHYSSFASEERSPMFLSRQETLRKRLNEECVAIGFDTSSVDADFETLRVLDVLSLLMCITAPGSLPDSWPPWLIPSPLLENRGMRTKWDGDTFRIDPFPLIEPLATRIQYRSLPRKMAEDEPAGQHLDDLERGLQELHIEPF